jgi:hypothetical protein
MVEMYKTAADFTGTGLLPYLYSIESAVPGFFTILTFCIWIFGTAASYFSILNNSGRKGILQSLTAMSFVSFLVALLFSALNSSEMTILSGYWVGFYILMTVTSYYLMDHLD